MNKAEILRLAGRVEALEVGDGRLNCLIENALGLAKFERDPRVLFGDADYNRVDPKPYTSSIDAAMGLVPPDSWHEIKGPRKYLNIPTPVPNYWSAHLARWNHEGDAMGWGATPALALTAAALRAIASTMEDDRG